MEIDPDTIAPLLKKHGYLIEEQIGRGAQGACFVVFSEKYSTKFVCKCMKLSHKMKESQTKQFDREIYSLSHVIHTNIVKIYEHFAEFQYMFMIIEYCQEGSLLSFIKKNEQLITQHRHFHYTQMRKYMIDILSALTYCHDEMKMSHHDIKPENIVIDQYGRAKICDFGLAHVLSSQFTELFARPKLGGTLLYLSPQLIKCALKIDQEYDFFAADVWAFGVTAYTILSMKYPFYGHTLKDVLQSQIDQLGPAAQLAQNTLFTKLPKNIPRDLMTVLQRSLAFEEADRARASELLEILKKTAANQLSAGKSSPQFNLKQNSWSITNLQPSQIIRLPVKSSIATHSNTSMRRRSQMIVRPVIGTTK